MFSSSLLALTMMTGTTVEGMTCGIGVWAGLREGALMARAGRRAARERANAPSRLSDPGAELVSAHVWHHAVEQDEVGQGLAVGQPVKRLRAWVLRARARGQGGFGRAGSAQRPVACGSPDPVPALPLTTRPPMARKDAADFSPWTLNPKS